MKKEQPLKKRDIFDGIKPLSVTIINIKPKKTKYCWVYCDICKKVSKEIIPSWGIITHTHGNASTHPTQYKLKRVAMWVKNHQPPEMSFGMLDVDQHYNEEVRFLTDEEVSKFKML